MNTRLLDLRTARKQSQTALAQYLNCSQRMYSRYERGEVNIPLSLLISLANYYNTSIDYLLHLTDIPTAYPKSKHSQV